MVKNSMVKNYMVKNFMVENFMVKNSMVENLVVKNIVVEESVVEMSYNFLKRGHFIPKLFNHKLPNPLVETFIFTKFIVIKN